MRQEMMGFWDGSGFSWTICKQPAPHSRQTTTPTPDQLTFYRPDALPDAQPTVSKHWLHVDKAWSIWIIAADLYGMELAETSYLMTLC